MYSPLILVSFSFSIFIAGFLALIRFPKINRVYYPFLICVWVACINEPLSLLLVNHNQNTIINNNVYVLIEGVLLTVFFKNLGLFKNDKKLFYLIIFGLILEWLFENLILHKITSYNIYGRIIYSFIIVFMSLNILNKQIAFGTKNIFKNSTFLLCLSFILYFLYKVVVYAFWIYGESSSHTFLLKLFSIMIYVNLLSNLIYALAVLWMPRKIGYTLPY
jgi:hypothetical protein